LKVVVDKNEPSVATNSNGAKPAELKLKITGSFMQKNALAALDVITSNFGDRPVYFNYTSMNTLGLDIQKYLIDEGLLYRLTANENIRSDIPVDTERAYAVLVANGRYSNLRRRDVFFHHEDFQLRMINPLRQHFNTLTVAYMEKGDSAMAKEVLQRSFENLFHDHLATAYADVYTAELLHAVGEKEKAKSIAIRYFNRNFPTTARQIAERQQPDRTDLYFLSQAADLMAEMGEVQYADKVNALLH
jgi:hypothetical protein